MCNREKPLMTVKVTVKWLPVVTLEVNLGEFVTDTSLPSVNKAVHSGLEPQRGH